jgi:pyruvate-ferredoxin/flavodoxin oxidoreductase
MAAGTGATASKYVARRETPLYIPENCTQCMECISACPDTALPNTAQDLGTILATAARNYVSDAGQREMLLAALPGVEIARPRADERRDRCKRERALQATSSGPKSRGSIAELEQRAKDEFTTIIDLVPAAYTKVPAVFKSLEKKSPGQGGVFSIFVSDLCKGCGECVEQCGDHGRPRHGARHRGAELHPHQRPDLLDCCPTPRRSISASTTTKSPRIPARRAAQSPHGAAQLRGARLRRRRLRRLRREVVLRAIASVTEAYMRPLYHRKADRLA